MKRSKFSVKPDGLFRQNIVLMSGLLTAPVIAACTTAENALVLVLSFFMISYTGILICRFIPRKIAYSIRILLYAIVAGAMFIPTKLVLDMLFPQMEQGVLLYVELLVVNSLLLAKTETRFYLKPYGEMAVDALLYVVGYALAAFTVGFIREMLAFGTLFGHRLFDPVVPSAKSPFFGFIMVGILAALCRAIVGKNTAPKTARFLDPNEEE
ncbi:MAG: NADH:ubiquinone oxidoreductase subunit RnfE [Oscillospiraceae bacterium]|nr:NADH:ubiquinone oxidoreductase subunit RnfE [Oscillospiraceae bacterium]